MTIRPRSRSRIPRQHRARAQERAGGVDVDLPRATRRASCACTRRAGGHAGVVDQHVDGPIPPKTRRHRGLVGHVESALAERDRPVARAAKCARDRRADPALAARDARPSAHADTSSKRRSGIRRTSLPVVAASREPPERYCGIHSIVDSLVGGGVQGPVRVPQVRAGERAQVGAAGEDDRVDVVVARDRADGDHRDARLVADPVGVRRLEAAPVGGLLVGRDLAGRDVDDVAAGLDAAGARTRPRRRRRSRRRPSRSR